MNRFTAFIVLTLAFFANVFLFQNCGRTETFTPAEGSLASGQIPADYLSNLPPDYFSGDGSSTSSSSRGTSPQDCEALWSLQLARVNVDMRYTYRVTQRSAMNGELNDDEAISTATIRYTYKDGDSFRMASSNSEFGSQEAESTFMKADFLEECSRNRYFSDNIYGPQAFNYAGSIYVSIFYYMNNSGEKQTAPTASQAKTEAGTFMTQYREGFNRVMEGYRLKWHHAVDGLAKGQIVTQSLDYEITREDGNVETILQDVELIQIEDLSAQ